MSNAADHGGSQPKTTPRAATPTPPSPQTGARQSVRLRLWGATAEDIARARNAATRHPSYNSWTIDVTEKNVGTPSTIPPADREALAQGAHYGWAWAAYPIGFTPSRRPS